MVARDVEFRLSLLRDPGKPRLRKPEGDFFVLLAFRIGRDTINCWAQLWKYAGVRFQGAGLDISGGGGPRSRVVTFPDGETATVSGGGGSVPAGVVTGDFMLRLPLDTLDRKSTRLNSSHLKLSRMPSSA